MEQVPGTAKLKIYQYENKVTLRREVSEHLRGGYALVSAQLEGEHESQQLKALDAIVNFIIDAFPNIYPEEVEIAFKQLCRAPQTFGTDGRPYKIEHFGKFTAEYVGRVLSWYREQKRMDNVKRPSTSSQQIRLSDEERERRNKVAMDNFKRRHKEGKMVPYVAVYESLEKNEQIEKDAYMEFVANAKALIASREPQSLKEFQQIKDILNSEHIADDVVYLAKQLFTKQWFDLNS